MPDYQLPPDPVTTTLFILVIILFIADCIVWGKFFATAGKDLDSSEDRS